MFFCVQLSGSYLKIALQKLGFSIFCVLSLKFEISPFLGLLKHYKIGVSANFDVFVVGREKRQKK